MLLEEEIKAFPENSAVIMAYGNCRFQLGRYLEAAEIYRNFLEKLGALESPTILSKDEIVRAFPALIAGAYDMAGDKAAAEKWYNIGHQWDPEDLQPLYWMGKKALDNNDLPAALDFFEQVIARPVRISRIGSDNETLRRNALGFLVLGKMQREPMPHKAIRSHLGELVEGGLDRFPIDYKIPAEYYAKTEAFDDLIKYYSKYLKVFPRDIEMYENYIETMIFRQEYGKVRKIFAENPELKTKSGVLAAFCAKSLEPLTHTGGEIEAERVYQVYLNGLRQFSAEPTLLVYLGEWINARRNFTQAYRDLRSIPSPSAELMEYINQLQKLACK
jgi:tetratricopeptide (TPR) repeat protein